MADGVLVTNRDLEIVLHNPALMRLFEFPGPLDEPSALRDCIADEELEKDLRSILDSPCEDAVQVSREFSKGDKYIRKVSAPIPGSNNHVLGTVTVFQDVTIFRQLNEMKSNFRAVGFS